MARRKVIKLSSGKKKDQARRELNAMAMERFSELPDSVLHRIFSFIPTIDAIRMSLLSKSWRRMWYSLPSLNFDDSAIVGDFNATMFSKLVSKCLKLRKADLLSAHGDNAITKFRLVIAKMWRWSIVNSWLSLVSMSNIMELDLSISSRSRTSYALPLNILLIKSLTRLRLSSVEVKDLNSASLPSVTSLSLEIVKLSDQVLCNLLLGCCSLERLVVKSCRGLLNPKVLSSSLKVFEIASTQCETLRVEAMNLESVICGGRHTGLNNLYLSPCTKLRKLSFTGLKFDDQFLEDLILGLPHLESLTLRDCEGLICLRICSQRLKYLFFERNGLLYSAEATVDCPNLVYFSYEGYLKSNSSMTPVKNLVEAKIKCHNPAGYDMNWYMNLIDFLSDLNCPENMSLDVFCEEALIFPNKLRKHIRSPLPTLKHLKVRTTIPSSGNPDLRGAINWLLPSLETLSIE